MLHNCRAEKTTYGIRPLMELNPKDNVGLLEPIGMDKQLDLKFERINCCVTAYAEPPSLVAQAKNLVQYACPNAEQEQVAKPKKQILYNVTGQVFPGEVFSLMGPSGSGKTSLLTIISGRQTKAMEVDGQTTCRGSPLVKSIKRKIGFVLQDDLLYDTLTVEETLMYSAMLRLPSAMPLEEKQQLVDTVISALGLGRCRGTMIGGAAQRGISGGERKRTSIGHELLINPAILMLDEPTSGLDSTIAYHLLVTLRQLAAGGRCIITTIHQPSSRMYQQLDKLMLLAEGRVMYYGAANKVVHWFSHHGFEMPFGVNTADFILDLATGQVGNGVVSGQEALVALTSTFEAFQLKHGTGFFNSDLLAADAFQPEAEAKLDVLVLNSDGQPVIGQATGVHHPLEPEDAQIVEVEEHTIQRDSYSEQYTEHKALPEFTVEELGVRRGRDGATYLNQLRVLLVRSVRVRRFESLSWQRFLQLNVVAVLTGMFWFQKGQHKRLTSAQDVVGLLFFELLFPTFSTMFSALFTFPQDYRMLMKERASGAYQLSAYYFSRLLSDLPMDCVYPAMFVTIIYWMGGLRQDAGSFFANLLSLQLLVFIAQSTGLLIGAVFMNAKQAQTVLTVIMLTCMLIGGYYVRVVPHWIEWAKYISFIYWGFNLLLKIQFVNQSYIKCQDLELAGLEPGVCHSCAIVEGHDLQTALGLQISPHHSVWPELVVLFGMLIALRIVIYVVLRWRTSSQFL